MAPHAAPMHVEEIQPISGRVGKRLRVLAITHTTAAEGCTQARVVTPLQFLQVSGVLEYEHVVVPPVWLGQLNSYIRLLRDLRNWDAIWIARPLYRVALPLIREARRLGKPLLVDIDDWLLDVPLESYDAKFYAQRAIRQTLRTALRAADTVTVSTPLLAERCATLGVNAYVLPNAISLERFESQPRSEQYVTVAFCGTVTHAPDMSLIAQPLRQLLRSQCENVHVVTVGCLIPELVHEKGYTHYDQVSASDYACFLSSLHIDVGLAPLHDTAFNRAKSDIKYLEYSAVGAVTIASPVTPYQAAIREDRGVLVVSNTPEAWFAAISSVVEDRRMRQRAAINAYDWVRRERSIGAVASSWHSIFHDHIVSPVQDIALGKRQLQYYDRLLVNMVLREPYMLGL